MESIQRYNAGSLAHNSTANDTFKAKSKKLSNNKRLFPIPSAYSLEDEKKKKKHP